MYKRDGVQPGFWDGMKQATLASMPQPLKDAYAKINPDPKGLQAMFNRDVARMLSFKDISDEAIQSITAPALIINGDADVIRPEHALELSKALPNGQLLILPGGHGEYIGEICSYNPDSKIPMLVTGMIEEFLKKRTATNSDPQ
jgi:pimeloyl-ACP methyl ester carboxylesterase